MLKQQNEVRQRFRSAGKFGLGRATLAFCLIVTLNLTAIVNAGVSALHSRSNVADSTASTVSEGASLPNLATDKATCEFESISYSVDRTASTDMRVSGEQTRSLQRYRTAINYLCSATELSTSPHARPIDPVLWKKMQRIGLMQYELVASELQSFEPELLVQLYQSIEAPLGFNREATERYILSLKQRYRNVDDPTTLMMFAGTDHARVANDILLKLRLLSRLLFDVPLNNTEYWTPFVGLDLSEQSVLSPDLLFPLLINGCGEFEFVDDLWWLDKEANRRPPSEELQFFQENFEHRKLG